jgi:hypothetical protein
MVELAKEQEGFSRVESDREEVEIMVFFGKIWSQSRNGNINLNIL